MGEQQYYDGGVYDNLPVEAAGSSAGCDKIILVVHLFGFSSFVEREPLSEASRILELRHIGLRSDGMLNFDPAEGTRTGLA
ncbi:MAG: hypothetical protein MZU97_01325 [Bacillus subtilis]|nr:hypothetical protein [Bacillus subtilis]